LAALLANLKRGPWIGVFFGLAFFLGKVKPKFLLPLFAFCLTIFATVPSIRDRLEESYNHFVIRGGRLIMWEVGSELVAKYPLGIGFGNSKFMRELDPSIPEVHRHFHNNFLNVTVETGWPGLLLYCWWILGSIYLALKRSSSASPQKRIALLAISTSLLSWQIAGLVEYSFGDSEVLFTAFVILGILGSLIIDKTKSDLLNQPIE
ncbi:MAG: O-antigen ligase family protein, partial [Bdellovibrionales bacterium]|nr:O-antigen ligase family protein [Bdellovibrionales bacterium]